MIATLIFLQELVIALKGFNGKLYKVIHLNNSITRQYIKVDTCSEIWFGVGGWGSHIIFFTVCAHRIVFPCWVPVPNIYWSVIFHNTFFLKNRISMVCLPGQFSLIPRSQQYRISGWTLLCSEFLNRWYLLILSFLRHQI